jgi:ribosomal protein S18 acetylase RimI-like enzyme
MIIRPANIEDWYTLKKVRLASLLDSPTAFGQTHESAAAYTDTQWRERASGLGITEYILALVEDRCVGLIGDYVSPSNVFNLIAMWVEPEYRGRPVAAGLVDAIKRRAVERGHARVVLDVSPENARAAAFYRKQGFTFLPDTEPLANHPEITVQKMEWLA